MQEVNEERSLESALERPLLTPSLLARAMHEILFKTEEASNRKKTAHIIVALATLAISGTTASASFGPGSSFFVIPNGLKQFMGVCASVSDALLFAWGWNQTLDEWFNQNALQIKAVGQTKRILKHVLSALFATLGLAIPGLIFFRYNGGSVFWYLFGILGSVGLDMHAYFNFFSFSHGLRLCCGCSYTPEQKKLMGKINLVKYEFAAQLQAYLANANRLPLNEHGEVVEILKKSNREYNRKELEKMLVKLLSTNKPHIHSGVRNFLRGTGIFISLFSLTNLGFVTYNLSGELFSNNVLRILSTTLTMAPISYFFSTIPYRLLVSSYYLIKKVKTPLSLIFTPLLSFPIETFF